MTTCCRSSDIKSSVYNQTGEGYFQQLSAYNHMSAHLRRILLAKSRVDSRNPNYIQRQRCKYLLNEKLSHKSISQEFIDKLAYDTQHHPMEILRMGYNFEENSDKYNRSQDHSKKYTTCNVSYIECPGSQIHSATIRQLENERSRSMSRTRLHGLGPTFHSARPGSQKKNQRKNTWRSRDEVDIDGISSRPGASISVNSSIRSSPRSNKSKNDNDPNCLNYASSFESSSETSRRGSPVPKVLAPSPNPNESDFIGAQRQRNSEDCSIKYNKNEEEAKYSKFLYDITQEIVQNGLYTDEELRNVFKKHMKKNLHILNKSKMIYELYQLKLSLNIVDQEDEEEEETIEQFIRTQKFSRNSSIKPPTPPKVLDENKLMDKLMNPDELREAYSKSPASGRNTVVLVDANPELVITERDILATLMEMNIEPKKAQTVYKRLQKRSRDLNNIQLVHPENEPIASTSGGRKTIQEREKNPSINRGIQYHEYSPMNINKDSAMEKEELLSINQDCPSTVTLKFSYREKCSNIRQDNGNIAEGKNTKSCQYETRSQHCIDASKTPLSIKAKTSNEKKFIEAKNKMKTSKELIDNQFACNTRGTFKRKTSSLSQLEGLQPDGMRTERMKKNIELEIKSSDRAQESKIKEHSTFYNHDNKNNKIEAPTALSIKRKPIEDKLHKFSSETKNNTGNSTNKIDSTTSTEFISNSPDTINSVHEYTTDYSDSSIIESLDDENESVNEKKTLRHMKKSNVDSNMEQINNRVQCITHGIINENTEEENQSKHNHGNKTIIEFPLCKNFISTEVQTDDTHKFARNDSKFCMCNQFNSDNNLTTDTSSLNNDYNNEIINKQRINNCSNTKPCVDSNSTLRPDEIILCDSCKNFITCIQKK
ncbi:hypothetical protein PV328_003227 [Microctonus aethiopoides]|uniref:Uncharacterized protein n=1 Tax=Microctonus aethiopoides TaxID=144406 RepID=A0AA39F7Z3_9HYME|nr:hypothetical protein PV328_003227 [Microctonus aethiopoides]